MNDEMGQALATLAVAAWANNAQGVAMADAEIDRYLLSRTHKGHDPVEALRALQAAYTEMKGDSATAGSIRLVLSRKITQLTSGGLLPRS